MSTNSSEGVVIGVNNTFEPAFQVDNENVDFETPRQVMVDGQEYFTRPISEVRNNMPPLLTNTGQYGARNVVVFSPNSRRFEAYIYANNGETIKDSTNLAITDPRVQALIQAYPYYDFDNGCIKEGY